MLSRFRKTLRIKATIVAVAAYAICVLAPNAVLAAMNASGTLHCLTERSALSQVHSLQKTETHKHSDGISHVHAGAESATGSPAGENSDHDSPGTVKETNCCGLFCVTAIAHVGIAVLPAPPPSGFGSPVREPERAAIDPLRIDEPPIS
jgi:hypothetical protein